MAFLIGDSTAFDWAMVFAGVKFRFLGACVSNIPLRPRRPLPWPDGGHRAPLRYQPGCCEGGADFLPPPVRARVPVHIGDAREIGIEDLNQSAFTKWAEIPPRKPGEVDMFWGCGCTPQTILEARPSLVITHKPAHMFITDRLVEEVAVF